MTVAASVMTTVRLLGGMGLCPGYFFCSSCVRLSFGMAFLLLVLICAFTPDSLQETSADKERRRRLGHDLTGCEVFDACFCRLDTAATVFSQPSLDPVLPIGSTGSRLGWLKTVAAVSRRQKHASKTSQPVRS